MKVTTRLFQNCHITLFVRANCSLCTDAKQVLSNVWDRRPFHFQQIDVMTAKDEQWKIYQFDTPVVNCFHFALFGAISSNLVQIHVDAKKELTANGETTTSSVRKLMHRFKEAQVENLMDEVEKVES
jgi:hypothetical protein